MVMVNPVPVAPVFTNSPGAAFVVAEGATAVGAAGFFIATGTGDVAYTLGGTDGALFGITAAGTLTFNDAPDFEMPRGMALTAGNTNNYALTVTATASSLTTELSILLRVTNVNEAPVLAAITPGTFTEYTAGTIAITATDVDAATTLSFALTGEAHGATLSGGTFTWTPGEDDGGVARMFSVTVTDDGSPMMSDSATFTITAAELANRAPASVAITLAGGVTAVTNPATLGVSATATDPDTGDMLTYTWSSSATGDSFSSDTGASVTWTPPPVTAVTTVTLTVTVSDDATTPLTTTATQDVVVNPVPVAPMFTNSPGAAFMVVEGATAVGGNAGFVATAAGATVTYSLSGADMAFFSIDAGGTLTFNDAPDFEMPRGMALAAGNTNDYALTVTATASSLTTELSITVSVTNVNEAPVLAAITPGTFTEYTAGTIAIAATDEDGTATTLSFALTGEAHGATLSGGTFTWTPGEDDGGVARMFSVTVTDDGSPMMSDTATFTITAAELPNRAPTSATIAGAATVVSPNTLTLTATGADPDTGDTLTFSWTVVTNDGGSLAPTTGASVTWTPPTVAAGGTARMITIRLTATDVGGATVTDDHTVTVNPAVGENTAPAFTNMAMFSTAIEAAENQAAAGAANFFAAPGSGTVTLTLGGTDMALFTLAANGTLTFNDAPNFEMPRGAALTGTNTNDYALTVTAMNSTGSTPSGAITVRVTDANDAPVLDAFPTVAFEEYSEGTLTITATDEDRPAQDLTFTFVGPDRGATLTAAGAFSWTPGEADGGVVRTFIIRVVDDNAPPAADTAPLAITATELPNRAPTGAAITTAGGVTAVTNPATLTVMATATDPDTSDTLTYTWSSDATGDSFSSDTGASVVWTPPTVMAAATVTLTVTVSDDATPPLTTTATQMVTVNSMPVVDTAPAFAAGATIAAQTYTQGTAITPLTLPVATGGNNGITYTLTPALPAGLTHNANPRTITGNPTATLTATMYTWTAADGDANTAADDTAALTFTIMVVEEDIAPAFAASVTIAAQTYTQGTAITPLTLPVATGGNNGITYTLTPALPTGLTHNAAARTITGNPTAILTATMYTWTAADGDTNTAADDIATLTFTIMVVEEDIAPAFAASVTIAAQTYTQGTAITPLTLPVATGGNNGITYTLTPALPTGLTHNAAARTITGNPTAILTATMYTWTAADGDTNTAADDIATLTFTITVAEEDIAPTFDNVAMFTTAIEAAENQTAAGAATFFAATGTAPITLTLGGTDAGRFSITAAGTLTFNDAPDFERPRGTPITGTNTNNYALTVIAMNSVSTVESGAITVTVTDVNEAPVLSAIPTPTFTEYTAGGFTITATDVDRPAQTLAFALTGETHGAALTAAGGFTWTPREMDGAAERMFTVEVTDSGTPPQTASTTFAITAAELANRAPTGVMITNTEATIQNPATLVLSATASDPDTGDTLTYTWSAAASGDGGTFSPATGARRHLDATDRHGGRNGHGHPDGHRERRHGHGHGHARHQRDAGGHRPDLRRRDHRRPVLHHGRDGRPDPAVRHWRQRWHHLHPDPGSARRPDPQRYRPHHHRQSDRHLDGDDVHLDGGRRGRQHCG